MQIVTFASAGGVHGIPVLAVEEFFRPIPLTRVPLADKRIAGLLNQRGKSATVLNLRQCFHRPTGEPALHPKMILLETEDHLTPEARSMGVRSFADPVVLLVDRILDIVNIDRKDWQPRPAHITEQFVSGVVRHGDGYICLLELPTLIDDIFSPKA
ncbi:MAG: chemotaxis protein CheW [Planctomycetaceae bacterium]|nr:chemotaxis protein CheW [Planctomycetaceae bacterium]